MSGSRISARQFVISCIKGGVALTTNGSAVAVARDLSYEINTPPAVRSHTSATPIWLFARLPFGDSLDNYVVKQDGVIIGTGNFTDLGLSQGFRYYSWNDNNTIKKGQVFSLTCRPGSTISWSCEGFFTEEEYVESVSRSQFSSQAVTHPNLCLLYTSPSPRDS